MRDQGRKDRPDRARYGVRRAVKRRATVEAVGDRQEVPGPSNTHLGDQHQDQSCLISPLSLRFYRTNCRARSDGKEPTLKEKQSDATVRQRDMRCWRWFAAASLRHPEAVRAKSGVRVMPYGQSHCKNLKNPIAVLRNQSRQGRLRGNV